MSVLDDLTAAETGRRVSLKELLDSLDPETAEGIQQAILAPHEHVASQWRLNSSQIADILLRHYPYLCGKQDLSQQIRRWRQGRGPGS